MIIRMTAGDNQNMVQIQKIDAGTAAAAAGLRAGDIIERINGEPINDGLDFHFYTEEDRLEMDCKRGDKAFAVTIVRDEQPLGIGFDSFLIDRQRSCRNKCAFCFIDQNPPGMRESIYVKDDDERMSFLRGSYITMTNLTEKDIARIIKMHLSPINVSVHSMNPIIRCALMNNRFAGKSLEWLQELSAHGIAINAQLVLCPDINDGAELVYSLKKLSELESLVSVSAVPVGLTKYRDGLHPLKPFDKESAARVIGTIERFARKCAKEKGCRMFYASDEFYLLAERPIPTQRMYDGYPQLENGVGMLRLLTEEFKAELKQLAREFGKTEFSDRRVTIATGQAAHRHICDLARMAEDAFGVKCTVYNIRNDFFGETVTVSGLITGGDLIKQLRGKELGEELLIPCNMLRYERDLFLDGVSVEELSKALNVTVTVTERGGDDLLWRILGLEEEE